MTTAALYTAAARPTGLDLLDAARAAGRMAMDLDELVRGWMADGIEPPSEVAQAYLEGCDQRLERWKKLGSYFSA